MKFGMLFNHKTTRYHPILFRPAPMPGGATLPGGVNRWKSKAHHTLGFATLDEATAYIDQTCKDDAGFSKTAWRGDWDGEGIPAETAFFRVFLI